MALGAVALLLISFIANSSGTRNQVYEIVPQGTYGGGKTFIKSIRPIRQMRTSLDLSLSFTPIGNGYQNLFQTAEGNDGVRAEYYRGDLAVIIGNGDDPGTSSYMIARGLIPGQEHALSLHISSTGRVTWTVDGAFGSAVAPSAMPTFSIIEFGNGFDGHREFKGQLGEIYLAYAVQTPQRPLPWMLFRLIAAAFAIAATAVFFSKRTRPATLPNPPTRGGGKESQTHRQFCVGRTRKRQGLVAPPKMRRERFRCNQSSPNATVLRRPNW